MDSNIFKYAIYLIFLPIFGSAQNTVPGIDNFVFYAERSIKIGPNGKIQSGDIGIRTAVNLQNGLSQLIIGKGTQCGDLFSPSVTLDTGASAGMIHTNVFKHEVNYRRIPEGKFISGSMPNLPLVNVSAGSIAVSVQMNKEETLKPGYYGTVVLNNNSVLRLTNGKYYFQSLEMNSLSKLVVLDGVADVYIAGVLTLYDHTAIGSQSTESNSGKISVSVAGNDPENPDRFESIVKIGKNVQIHGLLLAPHGTIVINDSASIIGAIAAFDIILGNHVDASLESGLQENLSGQTGSQQLKGYFGANQDINVASLAGSVPLNLKIQLDFGLPCSNPAGLKTFIKQVSDPKNPLFRKYLTQSQFCSTYGASPSDYDNLKTWASDICGFSVNGTFPSRLLLNVTGTADQIERGLHVNLVYRLRKDGSTFVAVDREPTLDLNTPILEINGLTDFIQPHLNGQNGTGYRNTYKAMDIRNAYLGVGSPSQQLDGTGQVVGIVGVDLFNLNDIILYDQSQTGLPTTPNYTNVKIVARQGGNPGTNSALEATADVELVQGMAPNAQILFFQGSTGITGHLDDILHQMANSTPALTIASCSLGFGRSDNSQQAIDQMAAQGVSFFTSSGDYGDVGDPQSNLDMDNQTLVGGTTLSTNKIISNGPPPSYPSNYYVNDLTWNDHDAQQTSDVTGGGIMNGNNQGGGNFFSSGVSGCGCWPQPFCCGSGVYIPDYQVDIDKSTNGASSQYRNYPDVAMLAQNVEIYFNGTTHVVNGTSLAAPLWAGFTALVNQQSLNNGAGLMGFLNPTIYQIGLTKGSAYDIYSSCFNDVKDLQNNSNGFGPGFTSVAGYDLCTGWGTPTDTLLMQLSSLTPLTPVPPPLTEIEFVITTGVDNLRNDDDNATANVVLFNGNSFQVDLSHSGSGSWSSNSTNTIDAFIPLSAAQLPTVKCGIASVTINLLQPSCEISCDNWDIKDLKVSLFNPGPRFPTKITQLDLTGSSPLQDGHTGLVRLSATAGPSGDGPSKTFKTTLICLPY